MTQGALSGLRIIELGNLVSAPFCARLFADYGADVIKIEPPDGDLARRLGPFPGGIPHAENSGLYFYLNTNKRGVTLDLDHHMDRSRFLDLITTADVLVENQRPRQMKEWGLTAEELANVNPSLVQVSITPFGQTGPYADWNGYDLNAFHLSASGSRYLGNPGEPPLEPGTFAADFFGGAVGAAWGLAAVEGRSRVGGGQQLDVSCAEVVAALFSGSLNISNYEFSGISESRMGGGMTLNAPAKILACKDGFVWLLAIEPNHWRGLARAMGDPEWMQADIWLDRDQRALQADFIYEQLQEWTMQHTKLEIMDACQSNGCPTTAILTPAELAEHPHLQERGFFEEIEHESLGRLCTLGPPFKLPASPTAPRRAAPLLGQHNAEVFTEHHERDVSGLVRAPSARSALPLVGLRVANFGWVWAGPVAGQTLAMLGAEVLKVESMARPDLSRRFDPLGMPLPPASYGPQGSVTINLKEPEGVLLARELVRICDVVIENFGPGTMESLGLGYKQLSEERPDLIMISMPAAGRTGSLRNVITYGMSLASLTGLDAITGYLDQPPQSFEQAYTDPYNGIVGTFAVLTALQHRASSGQGQHIDYSQQEAVMQIVGPAFMDFFMNGAGARTIGNLHPLGAAAPHGVFPSTHPDRWVSIVVYSNEEWQGLVRALGSPAWATASEYSTTKGRLANIDSIHERIADWTRARDDYGAAIVLQRHGVAATPVLQIADLLRDPHFIARGTWVEVRNQRGRGVVYGPYVKASRSPSSMTAGPEIGEHNDYVFRELLRLPESEYQSLRERRVIW